MYAQETNSSLPAPFITTVKQVANEGDLLRSNTVDMTFHGIAAGLRRVEGYNNNKCRR